jgi:DNA-3-methyladenine glycosylase I
VAGPTDPLYVAYHDTDWGVPEYDDRALFEKLHARRVSRPACRGSRSCASATTSASVIRRLPAPRSSPAYGAGQDRKPDGGCRHHPQPAEGGGRRALGAGLSGPDGEGQGFSNHLWGFLDGRPLQNSFRGAEEVPAETDLAKKISKDLKKRGFTFVGPTIVYAFMQAVGMVNDHLVPAASATRR